MVVRWGEGGEIHVRCDLKKRSLSMYIYLNNRVVLTAIPLLVASATTSTTNTIQYPPLSVATVSRVSRPHRHALFSS
jgi:hypothetical protein